MNVQEAVRAYTSNPEIAQVANQKMQELLGRASTDVAFRTKLLNEPRTAIAEFSGRPVSEIPESWNVKFIENKADATIVLPDPIAPEAELSEAELESVAGGSVIISLALSAVILVSYAGYKAATGT